MQKLFKKVPLRENYKETVDEYVRLKAPPNVSRACFIFELSVAATAFAISFYISFTSTTSVTSITYEPLDSPYVCKVLSPRSDLLSFSAKSSEVVAFSSSRYGYDECVSELGEDGMDVCADGNRQDFVLSLNGLKSSDENCLDLVLNNGYRFCIAQSFESYSNGVEAFPTSPNPPSTVYDSNSHSGDLFYFANTSATARVFSAPFTTDTIQSGWVSYGDSVFIVAESSSDHHNYIYEFAILDGSTDASTLAGVTQHGKIELGGSTLIGFSVANDVAYVWSAKGTSEGQLNSYNLKTKAAAVSAVDCTSMSDNSYSTPSTGSASRMFYASDDGYLYAMCGTTVWNNAFTFYQIDAADVTVRTQLHVDIESIPMVTDSPTATNVTTLKSIYASGGYAYFMTGEPNNNLIQVDLSPQPTAMPSARPSSKPSPAPPTFDPTKQPTMRPTMQPTVHITAHPTVKPTIQPTPQPVVGSVPPSRAPTIAPTDAPNIAPSEAPTVMPTAGPTNAAPPLGPPPVVRRRLSATLLDGSYSDELGQTTARISLADGPPAPVAQTEPFDTFQPAENLGVYTGSYMSQGFGNTIYFNTDSGRPTSSYYNITLGAFESYDDLFDDYFRAVSVQIGYAYAICNGQVLNVTIDPTVSTDYKDQCDDINGIYYQKNAYFSVPASCAGVFLPDGSNINDKAIDGCPDLLAIAVNFTTTDCESSFEKICDAAYTDNPPFSCTIEERPDFLTTLGSALSNASALWSLIAVLISITLRRTYPGGVLARDFDASGSKTYQAGSKSALVFPIAEVDEGVEMGNRGGGSFDSFGAPSRPVTTQPSDDAVQNGSNDRAKPQAQKPAQETEEKEGYCEMFWDECTGC